MASCKSMMEIIKLKTQKYSALPGLLALLCSLLLSACGDSWNNPYPDQDRLANILYSSFEQRPKHLDPARAYSSNEYAFIGQIYEPPLQYHYLKRPYELIPLTATGLPSVKYFDSSGSELTESAPPEKVHESVYTISIRPGIQYQPHPALASNNDGSYRYHNLQQRDLSEIHELSDFALTGSRELTADDYVYQMKRLAHPSIHSPILGLMAEYIVGLDGLAKTLREQHAALKGSTEHLDLRKFDLSGVKLVDRYTYQIRIRGKYPQLVYWLSMPFFAPMPWEADVFYQQAGMQERNISLDWYPIGTAAYQLTVNNPNRHMILEKNPNYRVELYPAEGDPGDAEAGLLDDAGKPLPFIDRIVFNLEKETIPYWNKFLQGYYDTSGISSESFDQAVQMSNQGELGLTDEMASKGINLSTAVQASSMYFGFNMLDPVVGGLSERARKLRQAISIAMDMEEFISIFSNGRGIPAQGVVPPGIFGYRDGEAGVNPVVYDWVGGKPKRKSIEVARRLLAEAGYPDGVDAKTGKPLVINFDLTASGPDDKARLNWYRKQFDKLNIQLVIRNTMYNRFQEKMLKGTSQFFIWGWNADYPDPENFMFLLYGPNQKADKNGENAANYRNPQFDALFTRMKNMNNGQQRQQIIDRMTDILRQDSPWVFGYHPKSFGLQHSWYKNAKPNLMAHNTFQYKRIDTGLRAEKRQQWNQPIVWPVIVLIFGLVALSIPALFMYKKRENLAVKDRG